MDRESMEVKHVYGEDLTDEMGSSSFCAVGEKLYLMDVNYELLKDGTMKATDARAEVYDLSSYESEGQQEVIQDFLLSEEGAAGQGLFMPGRDGASLYFAGKKGIYRFKEEGSAIEKIFTGEQGQMYTATMRSGLLIKDDVFLI